MVGELTPPGAPVMVGGQEKDWCCVGAAQGVYSCYFFLISSASVRSIRFLSFSEPIFA